MKGASRVQGFFFSNLEERLRTTSGVTQGLFLVLQSKITPVELGEPYVALGIKPRLAACNANTLPTVLYHSSLKSPRFFSLWQYSDYKFHACREFVH